MHNNQFKMIKNHPPEHNIYIILNKESLSEHNNNVP